MEPDCFGWCWMPWWSVHATDVGFMVSPDFFYPRTLRRLYEEVDVGYQAQSRQMSPLMHVAVVAVLAFVLGFLPRLPMAHAASVRTVSPGGVDAGDCVSSPCATIAYAIGQSVDGDIVELAVGTYTEGGIVVDKDLTIRGQRASLSIVQAHQNANTAADRVFLIDYGTDVVLQDLTVRHGNTTADGGGIRTDTLATLVLERVTVRDNEGGQGGGVYSFGDLTVISSTIRGNVANGTYGDGGGLHTTVTGKLRVLDSLIADNEASDSGGGIQANWLTIQDSVVSGNRANGTYGQVGGISSGSVMTATRVTVVGNVANEHGGGIRNGLGDAILSQSVISGNVANKNGGGIFNTDVLTIERTTVYSNSAGQVGGGIYHLSDSILLDGVLVEANAATSNGGGIDSVASLTMKRSTVSGNHAGGSGGGLCASDGMAEISGSSIVGNVADGGGGIYAFDGYVRVKSSIVVSNSAQGLGSDDDCERNLFGYGDVTSWGYNLYGQGTGCPVSYGHDKTTDAPASEIDLTLADNGGETRTHAVLAGGQAIDGGSCTDVGGGPLMRDQRGALRPRDGDADGSAGCDKGAYELYTGTGPAGVGAVDGRSALVLWLRCSDGVYKDTSCSDGAESDDPIACWSDRSGHGNEVRQSASGSRPLLKAGVLNDQSAARFDGSADVLASGAFSAAMEQPNSLLLVTRFTGDGQVAIDGLGAGHRQQLGRDAGEYTMIAGGVPISGGGADVAFHILGGTFDSMTSSLSVDGVQVAMGDPGSHAMDGVTLGAASGGSAHLAGDIAEAIVFGRRLNGAQRVLIANYLSARYDVALGSGGRDLYAGDAVAQGDYDTDVAGVGKEADGINPGAHSAGLILVNDTFLVDEGDYVLVGHGGTPNGTTSADLTGDVVQRWARVWYLDRTDGGAAANGTLQVAFDFGEGGMAAAVSDLEAYSFTLLRFEGGSFSRLVSALPSVVGDMVVFEVAAADVQDGIYTLGYRLGTAIDVTTMDDELNGDGDCSLREAIEAANSNAAVSGCPAGSALNPDIVNVPGGSYMLGLDGAGEDANASGDLDVLEDVYIRGAGALSTTISGGQIDRVLDVADGSVLVTIEDLSITDGQASQGGGLRNQATLTLNRVVVAGNLASTSHGGGIYNLGGMLTLNECTVSHNIASLEIGGGGGISNHSGAVAMLDRCTVSGNASAYGGGINNYGGVETNELTLTNTTVSGNAATWDGGGLYSSRSGLLWNPMVLVHSTIADNTADSDDNGSGDGGGVYNDEGVSIVRNTVIADNHDLSGGTSHPDWSLDLRSEGYVLLGDSTGTTLSQDEPSTDMIDVNPGLAPLAENGGETETHALSADSPARDALPLARCWLAVDQRGVPRPQRSACDLGAYEHENEVPIGEDDVGLAAPDTSILVHVLLNDSDPEGDVLRVTGVGSPVTGTTGLVCSTTVAYTPALSFVGSDVFTYVLVDSYGAADVATVTVTVGDAELIYLPLVLRVG